MKRQLLVAAITLLLSGAALSNDTVNERAPKSPAQQGEAAYLAQCAACHQPTGVGLAGAFPPLAQSDYLAGKPIEEVIGTVLTGLSGALQVNGKPYNGVMPAMSHLPDADIAAILTHVYASWNGSKHAVTAEQVSAVRKAKGVSTDPAQGESHPARRKRRPPTRARRPRWPLQMSPPCARREHRT